MNSKVLLATLAGAVFYFLFGWLVFGILLMDSMESGMSETMKSIYRGSDNYEYLGFVVSNVCSALLMALVLNKFGVRSFGKGFLNGLWIGLLMIWSYDFGMYAQFTLYDMNMILMDGVMGAIMTGLLGGVVGMVLGMGKKPAAA